MPTSRRLYVISDLHLGGRVASGSDRGFQMMTHPDVLADFVRRIARERSTATELVINGDFVDFLAEEGQNPGEWTPLLDDPQHAVTVFKRMATDETRGLVPVFAALGELLSAGHRLTVLLGNHDIELSYPDVRRELSRAIGVPTGRGFQFVYDGEAYQIGRAHV